ncbi:MAG TPA: FtsK/SpoIIIE domain-containing protein, partial [Solirubrobacteraceae bacterium]|nr:FtsK/SpoIIIE domain-containing protein [Solirubrobacteraceae bacterium]
PRLWERRPAHPDHLRLALGLGTVPWTPPLDRPHDPAPAALDAVPATLDDVPVTVDLSPGNVVGVVGDRAAALALARALLCQAAVLTGPADLRVGVLTREPSAWAWARWLPHVAPDDPNLLVVDDPALTSGRPAPVRDALASGTVSGIVVAGRADELPASCTVVVTVDADGAATFGGAPLLTAGAPEDVARRCALALARVDDPEVPAAVRTPERVTLLPLLGLDAASLADALAERWRAARPTSLAVPLGVTDSGPFAVDLVADGPHALVGGTTGSGKSELLRTLVAALAATHSPDDLTFVLVDYKGGSAFADCARLPHVVGFVTDLDAHLGARALACLEAELRHRERVLRDAAVPDLLAYAAAGRPLGPLPRLVVVVDEFATLAAELGDFVDSLVGIAQRGRSLGVHLVLATQRPNGAVNDNIRANTTLRVALRVTDTADSTDVVGAPDAAALSRRTPGRGYARLGPGELTAFQAALVSTTTPSGGARVALRPFGTPPPAAAADGPSDLAALVAAAREAASALRLAPPRLPWPPPLPPSVEVPETPLPEHGVSAPLGLADEPGEQRQVAYEWTGGNLFLYGVPGSGTSTALVTLALSLARRYDPSRVHVYALDFGTAALAPLVDLPHVGAVVQPPERDRQQRLVRHLRDEVARRRRLALEGRLDGAPHVVLLVDGWAGFEAAYDDVSGLATRDDLVRVLADGPALGISTVATADRVMGVPMSVAALAPAKLLLRLADPSDYAAYGIRDVPAMPPGRAIDVATGREVQLALPPPPPAAPATTPAAGGPAAIGALPDHVTDSAPASVPATGPWLVPVGVADTTLAPASLALRAGEPALVAGPARSGRSGLLAAVAASFADTGVLVTAVAYRPSPLTASPRLAGLVDDPADLPDLLAALATDARRHLLLVDDAELVDHPDLATLLAERRPTLRAVVAGRADALRTAYGHWTDIARRSRTGVLLKPDDADGDLLGVALPRRAGRFGTGRGYLVADGDVELIQAVT